MLRIHNRFKQKNSEYLLILCKFSVNFPILTYFLSSEPPKPPPRPITRAVATDTFNLLTQKDIACGSNESTHNRDSSTDTISLISLHDRASGVDIPPELLSRHVSTDTRTLISIRDNFSTTIPVIQNVLIDAQTQSTSAIQQDASSNTLAPAEQRHTGVQVCDVIDLRIRIMIRWFVFLRQHKNNRLSSIIQHPLNLIYFISSVIYVIIYQILILNDQLIVVYLLNVDNHMN